MKTLVLIMLVLVGAASMPSSGYALRCKNLLTPRISNDFSPTKPLRFMSMNTLNLYLHQGKYLWTDDGLERINQDHLPRQKPEWQTKGLADAILNTQPDFIMLQEVEGRESLDRFNRRYLDRAYKVYMPATNDGRGIGTAFLVRHGMGIKVHRKSFTDLSWTNKNGQLEKVFTRSFPLFEVFFEDHKTPKLIVAGVHYKSKRNRKGDPGSFHKRKKEAEESVRILKKTRAQYPHTPMIVMGDFNSTRDQKELESFRDLNMVDLNEKPEFFEDEGGLGESTFVSFPKSHRGPRSEALDGALLSPDLESRLKSFTVYRYKDEKGQIIPLPKNFEERNKNPSDHYPVLFDLNPDFLYGDFRTRF